MPFQRLRFFQLLIVALSLFVAGRAASAQTVILTKAQPGATAELVINDAQVATATAAPDGVVTLQAPTATLGQRQIDALVWVDICGQTRRIVIAERAVTPPASGVCNRTQLDGLFHVQRISSLVIDIGTTPPTMLLRQGEAPRTWIYPPTDSSPGPSILADARTGLMLFGAVAASTFRDYAAVACGNVITCSVDKAPGIGIVGASFWFSPFVAAEATFMRPQKLTASSDADGFEFDSTLDGGVVTVAGMGGVPLGPLRFYGKLGATYHRATHSMTQTTGEILTAVDGNPVVIPGSTQSTRIRTSGWGAVLGFGGEYWLARRIALYGEVGQMTIKGKQEDGGEATIDDFARYAAIGVRVNMPRLW